MPIKRLRKDLNPRQKALREALTYGEDAREAIRLFMELHGILHSRHVAPDSLWSYEDLLLDDLPEDDFRRIPDGEEHSVAWIVWHLSRIEDVTMNLLVAGRDQVFEAGNWLEKTNSPFKHTLNGTGLDAAARLSAAVDIPALRAYRNAVGCVTREIVQGLTCEDFKRKPEPESLGRITAEGAVIAAGLGVVAYWSRRDVAGLLLMPPTRHTIVHWNEAQRIIHRLN